MLYKQVVACTSVSKLSTTLLVYKLFVVMEPTFGHANAKFSVLIRKIFCVYKESISKEMNDDNDLNLHLNDRMSGRLRYEINRYKSCNAFIVK